MLAAIFSQPFFVLLQMLLVSCVVLAQDAASISTENDPQAKKPLKIVPLVSLEPGETKKLLFSTHCTVGATRGGGFKLAEMRAGTLKVGQSEGYVGASYSRDGVLIKLPGWKDAVEFAASQQYTSLQESGIDVFEITISATTEAKPELLEMHLVDATCSGHCTTDFRVLVISP